jgi:VIT1/CCC1 family predicted Fe2+/Mn2+ transporter
MTSASQCRNGYASPLTATSIAAGPTAVSRYRQIPISGSDTGSPTSNAGRREDNDIGTQRDTQRGLLLKEREEPTEMLQAGTDREDLVNPWQAAVSSAIAFTLGGVVPLIAILLPPVGIRVPVTFLSALIALVLTGTVSATLGGASKRRAVRRVVLGGALAMLVTYGVGQLVGTSL